MRLNLSHFEYKITGSGTKARFLPFFLSHNNSEQLGQIIEFYEKNLGKKKKHVDFDSIVSCFSSDRLVKGICSSLSRFYMFKNIDIARILENNKASNELYSKEEVSDIQKYLERKKALELSFKTVEELREKVFSFVNSNYDGFIKSEERDSVILDLENRLSLPNNTLIDLLYTDLDQESILVKNKDCSLVDLIRFYNYDVIETTLSHSHSVIIYLNNLPGYIAKNIVYISKTNYCWSEIKKSGTKYIVNIEPPFEAYRSKKRWGKNIASVAMYIIKKGISKNLILKIQAIVKPRKRKALFELDETTLPLLEEQIDEETSHKPEIDSKIEEHFYQSWNKKQGWEVIIEPDTLLIKNELFIPDFILKRGDKQIYVEIVGFYTEKYIQKKKNKMKEIFKLDIPIIYLIDENLKQHFAEMININKIFYSDSIIPNNSLIQLLEEKFSDFEERLELLIKELKQIVASIKKKEIPLTYSDLKSHLQIYSVDEAKKLLSNEKAITLLSKEAIIEIEGYGIIPKTQLDEIKSMLKRVKNISLDELKETFPKFKEGLIAICQYLGCQTHWRNIAEIEIHYEEKHD